MSMVIKNFVLTSLNQVNQTTNDVIIIVSCVLVFLGLFVLLYMLIAFRRMAITTKKIDYLVEDLAYRLEMFSPALEAIVKLSNYVDLFEAILNENVSSTNKFIKKNKFDISKLLEKAKTEVKAK
jgi:hypothetical protein